MTIDIDVLSERDLIDLNHRIVERLRILQQMKAHKRMMTFSIGERVRFRSHTGELIKGVIVRYNQKTMTIITDDRHRWNVSPSLIEKDAIEGEVVTPNSSAVALITGD